MFSPFKNIYVSKDFKEHADFDKYLLESAQVVSQIELYEQAINNLRNGTALFVCAKKSNFAWRFATGTTNPDRIPYVTESVSGNLQTCLLNSKSVIERYSRGEIPPAFEFATVLEMLKSLTTVKGKFTPIPDSTTYYDLGVGELRSFKHQNIHFTCTLDNGEFFNKS